MALNPVASHVKRQLRASLDAWKGKVSAADRPLFTKFVEVALDRIRGPFLATYSAHQVLSMLEAAFTFSKHRQPGEVKVEITAAEKGLTLVSNMADQPFIVDTIRLFLRTHKAEYWGGFNMVFSAERDAAGALIAVGDGLAHTESVVLYESDVGRLCDALVDHAARLRDNLVLAASMVRDFKPMVRAVERFVEKLEVEADRRPDGADEVRETAEFLKWLLRENFVFMGIDNGEALGIQSIPGAIHGLPDGDWPHRHDVGLVRVRKSSIESPLHRAGRIDEILVEVGAGAEAQRLFLRGMFTYRAVTQPSRNVPILRRVLAMILQDQQSQPGSYRYKGMANVFDSLPTEFLLTASMPAIGEMVDLVFDSEQQQEAGVTLIPTGQDSAFCLVSMPKEQFSDDLRRELEDAIVTGLKATYSDHGLFIGRFDTVLLHYFLTGARVPGEAGVKKLTERIRQLATPWASRLWAMLANRYDTDRADVLANAYGQAFPDGWVRDTPADRAVRDIEMLESLGGDNDLVADCFTDHRGDLILRLYESTDVYLSDLLPVLGNFGLVVVESSAHVVNARGGSLYIDTFKLGGATGLTREQVLARSPLLISAIEAVFAGKVENDRLNGLVLGSGLTWEEVDLVRGYQRYARQLQLRVSQPRVEEILLKNPIMTHTVVDYFHARFDPDIEGDREELMNRGAQAVKDELRLINSHDEDLTFSFLFRLMKATLRTNFYRTDRAFHYLSFKFDGARLKVGDHSPMFEISVHHKDVEGVHLRFGKVARGGIRWSDRADYRTEVLGLVSTQLVKNVVIVPTGSKGGFFLRHPGADPRERRREADLHYETFIRGLLDLTDNAIDGVEVQPPRVVAHDAFDPYLVVAADKGTAHLSDTANRLSVAYQHWLGDAFASGGSVGYDHKEVGITARGAWVLAKRHFAEMGRDPYTEPFTCVGVGDMSGDVFGNGLIESQHAKLLAAFNHLHIFLDPHPDAARSYAERKRLFDEVKGWDAYDVSTISEGGGVFDRRAKSVPLSPQAQALLGLDVAEAEPEVVIKRILLMDVDLLWNGGIGTYVKASFESHADADDRSNNAVRINGDELRAKVIGEGGNLGFTQQARIEAAQHGVRLNTDAIDNSGGVDLSDHEVNLKILLGAVVRHGALTGPQRDALLAEMTDEVAGLVLANNDAHGRQLSRDQVRSKEDIFQFGRAISFVERQFARTRDSLHLPSNDELVRRASRGEGLTRPELAVLSAWVKMFVFRELVAGQPRALPGFDRLLIEYFPKTIQARFAVEIQAHMLANEIAMTQATTTLVGDAGAAFVPMAIETTGASVPEIAAAYFKAIQLAGKSEVRSTFDELRATVGLSALYEAWVRVDAGARDVVRYWLSSKGRIPTDAELEEMRDAVSEVYALQANDVWQRNEEAMVELARFDIPESAARLVLKAQYLNIALMIWSESRQSDLPFSEMVVRHLAVARASGLQAVLDDLATRPAQGRWDPIALRILHARFHQLLRILVTRTPVAAVASSVDVLEPQLASGVLRTVRQQVDELLDGDSIAPVATLLVLEERVETAIARLGT